MENSQTGFNAARNHVALLNSSDNSNLIVPFTFVDDTSSKGEPKLIKPFVVDDTSDTRKAELIKPFTCAVDRIRPLMCRNDFLGHVDPKSTRADEPITPLVCSKGFSNDGNPQPSADELIKPFFCISDMVNDITADLLSFDKEKLKWSLDTNNEGIVAGETKLTVCSQGVFLTTLKTNKKIQLTNFFLHPVRIITDIYVDRTDLRIEFILTVNEKEKPAHIFVYSGEIDSLMPRIQKIDPTCWINSAYPKASARILEQIRKQLIKVPQCICFKQVGWQKYCGEHIYAHDGISGSLDAFTLVETGKTLLSNVSSSREASKGAYMVLQLSSDPSKIVPIFLFAHLSLMWSIFKEAGHSPQFLFFINGTSGALKTAVSKFMFSFFNSDKIESPSSFKDTSASLEVKMSQTVDSVLLVDDFHPATTAQERNSLRYVLERIIRFFGDSIGRSRCNVDMTLKEAFEPHGMCMLTGEDTAGTESTLLRCVIIEVSKGTFDGKVLAVLQENPLLWSSHLAYFVKYVGQNYDQIQELIKKSFPLLRERYAKELYGANRLVDAATYLAITARVVIDYFKRVDYTSVYASEDTFFAWERAILDALIVSKSLSRQSSPALLFTEAISQLYASGQIVLAEGKDQYQSQKDSFVGFKDGNKWWLCPGPAYSAVRKYWLNLGKVFVISQTVLFKDMASKGLIYTEIEKRTSGENKNYYTLKSSFGNRARFLVISYDAMDQFLAEEE